MPITRRSADGAYDTPSSKTIDRHCRRIWNMIGLLAGKVANFAALFSYPGLKEIDNPTVGVRSKSGDSGQTTSPGEQHLVVILRSRLRFCSLQATRAVSRQVRNLSLTGVWLRFDDCLRRRRERDLI